MLQDPGPRDNTCSLTLDEVNSRKTLSKAKLLTGKESNTSGCGTKTKIANIPVKIPVTASVDN